MLEFVKQLLRFLKECYKKRMSKNHVSEDISKNFFFEENNVKKWAM